MRSAFGIEHLSKGIPKRMPAAGFGDHGVFVRSRLQAHNKGKLGFKGGKKARDTARRYLQSYEEPRRTRRLP